MGDNPQMSGIIAIDAFIDVIVNRYLLNFVHENVKGLVDGVSLRQERWL